MEKLKLENLEEKELEEKMYKEIKELIENGRRKILSFANTELVNLYWHIGKNIVNNFQKGNIRAKYGTHLLENLSIRLNAKYGSSYSKRNLERMRKFYLCYPIATTLLTQLSWSHYLELLKIKEEHIRNFYAQECIDARWEVRDLRRMIKSHLYERLLVSIEDNKLILQKKLLILVEI